jgi:bifunctional DNA-binding transcriptional regulator/antitoxin component of YhaV-PrlF toxin-antitoxin module
MSVWMKETNIVIRIDRLGKVVIPRIVWDELDIKENDAFGIFVFDGGVYFKKVKENNNE